MIILDLKVVALSIFLFCFMSCSTPNKTLSFFFDGVIDSQKVELSSSTYESEIDTSMTPSPETKETVVIDQAMSMHTDYQKKLCEKCHDISHSYRLIQRQPELCYKCHQKFESKFPKLHGPVAAGFCTACHVPHKSQYKALLQMPVRQVCQHCHEPGDMTKNEAHNSISKIDCLECHDSHGGETMNFLKRQN
jgi:predicted CXXCH cytochrome family protein